MSDHNVKRCMYRGGGGRGGQTGGTVRRLEGAGEVTSSVSYNSFNTKVQFQSQQSLLSNRNQNGLKCIVR